MCLQPHTSTLPEGRPNWGEWSLLSSSVFSLLEDCFLRPSSAPSPSTILPSPVPHLAGSNAMQCCFNPEADRLLFGRAPAWELLSFTDLSLLWARPFGNLKTLRTPFPRNAHKHNIVYNFRNSCTKLRTPNSPRAKLAAEKAEARQTSPGQGGVGSAVCCHLCSICLPPPVCVPSPAPLSSVTHCLPGSPLTRL